MMRIEDDRIQNTVKVCTLKKGDVFDYFGKFYLMLDSESFALEASNTMNTEIGQLAEDSIMEGWKEEIFAVHLTTGKVCNFQAIDEVLPIGSNNVILRINGKK